MNAVAKVIFIHMAVPADESVCIFLIVNYKSCKVEFSIYDGHDQYRYFTLYSTATSASHIGSKSCTRVEHLFGYMYALGVILTSEEIYLRVRILPTFFNRALLELQISFGV